MRVQSGGEAVDITSARSWATRIIERNVGPHSPGRPAAKPSVRLDIDGSTVAFPIRGMRVLTRGAYADERHVVVFNAGGSGFDMLFDIGDDVLDIVARYRPSTATRAANLALPARFGLLAGQVLVHYPVLWRASWRGRVPLHVSVLQTSTGTPLLAGPGGVGKSTLVSAALRSGAVATADNLCSADSLRCYGLVEPLRTDAARAYGSRTSHGRVQRPIVERVPALTPDRLVVLERGQHTSVTRIRPAEAARALVAGTYAAGELRRYWALAATLSLGSGRGPVHPQIDEIASAIAERIPCTRVRIGDGQVVTVETLCDGSVGSESEWLAQGEMVQ